MLVEQDIPIDINSSKLLDWLISRRHCSRDWQKNILLIRKKINDAIQDMPAVEEITQLLVGTYINYFHCLQIVSILKTTEASSKNIFGQYSSQRMKDWQEIIKLYEADNIYLAEAAQMLIHNVTYEIPSLKKHISKCAQLQEECLKKEKIYEKNSKDSLEAFQTSCKQIGIEGQNIKKELVFLLEDLPEVLTKISVDVKELHSAVTYYISFLKYTLRKDCHSDYLPLMQYVIEKGNTTTYEWITGDAPDVVEVTKLNVPIDADNGSIPDDQIDFGDIILTSESGSNDDRSSSSPNGDFVHIGKDDLKTDLDSIDFGDEDSLEVISTESFLSERETPKTDGGKIARGDKALLVLENPQFRRGFYNELIELNGFLEQRLKELKSVENDVLAFSQFQSAPDLPLQKEISDMASEVQEIRAELTTMRMQHLLLIKESPKYVNRLCDNLMSKLHTSDKMIESAKLAKDKYFELYEEQVALQPKLDLIIKRTKELQTQMEADISKRYKNRPVNITGAVNLL